jgi:uncharacterized integral membrane protein (TIGR00698 family)
MLFALPLVCLFALLVSQMSFAQSWGIGSLPLAIVAGIVLGNLLNPANTSKRAETWLNFSKRTLLRAGIVLFGSNLTLQQLVAVGWQAAVLDALVITSVLSLGYVLGVRALGMSREETILTSVGSAVCGAAAILATEPVLKARQQHVSVAVATVVVFGTLALFCYPLIYSLMPMPSEQFGIYIGSTVHEVAQAVAAGQAIDAEAMNTAVIVKLMRVMMLAPVVIVIAWLYQRSLPNHNAMNLRAIPIPWFVFGFVLVVAVNSLITAPSPLVEGIQLFAQVLLTIAMAALGLQTRFNAVKAAGSRPLILSACLFVLLLAGGYAVHRLLY